MIGHTEYHLWTALALIVGGYACVLVAAHMNDRIVGGRSGGIHEPWFNLAEFIIGIGGTLTMIAGAVLLIVTILVALYFRS